MNATAEGEGSGDPPPAAAGEREAAYFGTIEDAFVRLRGAPLLLSPADFQVALRWFRDGVPGSLVVAALEEVFARRRERGARGRINSLRYCAPAVEAAWEEMRELRGPAQRPAADGVAVAERLAALGAALQPAHSALAARLLGLGGEPQAVEEALRRLDEELVAAAAAALDAAARERLAAEVDAILEGLRGRFPAAELATLREQLFRQRLRRLAQLPVLTLF